MKSRRRPDVETTVVAVENVRFGDGSYPVIAGPAVVEDEQQVTRVAEQSAAAGASILRAGTFRMEGSPYDFAGLGQEGLWLLEKAGNDTGLPTMTEVQEPGNVEVVADHVAILEIGADHMQDFVLLQTVGETRKPVVLRRGPSATIDEWLMSAEYILAGGNEAVVLCEGGSRGFDPRTSNSIEISAVPVVQQMTHLPVIIDPAPVAGGEDIIGPLALAGRSVGADGIIVTVHPDPSSSRVGSGSQLDLESFVALMESLGIPSLRDEIDRIDRDLIRLVSRRLRSSVDIARIKASRGLALRSPDREAELLEEARQDASILSVDPDYIEALMTVVLNHSRAAQYRALTVEEDGGA